MSALIEQLHRYIKGEITDDAATLEAYSRDASLFVVRPKVVVYPKDVADLENLVHFVFKKRGEEQKISLTPRLAGTDMIGGPLSESIVVDLAKYFNHLGQVGSSWAIIEPGVYYRDFEQETLKHNLLLPSYPASRDLCTVGGMVANNAGGEKTLAYGKTERYVEKVKMVLSDGQEYEFRELTLEELEEKKRATTLEGDIYRQMHKLIEKNYDLLQRAKPQVSKNSAGYNLWDVYNNKRGCFDLTKVIVGSQGTLGIITEIKFRLIRPKKYSRLAVIFLKNLKPLVEVTHLVMRYQPESFESFDDHTLKLAIRFLPGLIKILKPKNLLKL